MVGGIDMKATELMIGDWLRYSPKSISMNNNYGGLYRAEGVSQDTISLGAKNYRFVVSDKEIDPIPLTAEILEKNGFKYKTTDWDVVYEGPHYGKYNLKKFHVLIGKENVALASHYDYIGQGDVDAHVFAYINYVHELQHALRLCGLYEFADNFKV